MTGLMKRVLTQYSERRLMRAKIVEAVGWFADNIEDYDIPSDGLVLIYDDIEYGRSLWRDCQIPERLHCVQMER